MSRTAKIALVLIGSVLFFTTLYSCIEDPVHSEGSHHRGGGFLFFPRMFGWGGSSVSHSTTGGGHTGGTSHTGNVTRGGFGGTGSAIS